MLLALGPLGCRRVPKVRLARQIVKVPVAKWAQGRVGSAEPGPTTESEICGAPPPSGFPWSGDTPSNPGPLTWPKLLAATMSAPRPQESLQKTPKWPFTNSCFDTSRAAFSTAALNPPHGFKPSQAAHRRLLFLRFGNQEKVNSAVCLCMLSFLVLARDCGCHSFLCVCDPCRWQGSNALAPVWNVVCVLSLGSFTHALVSVLVPW